MTWEDHPDASILVVPDAVLVDRDDLAPAKGSVGGDVHEESQGDPCRGRSLVDDAHEVGHELAQRLLLGGP